MSDPEKNVYTSTYTRIHINENTSVIWSKYFKRKTQIFITDFKVMNFGMLFKNPFVKNNQQKNAHSIKKNTFYGDFYEIFSAEIYNL